MTKPPSAAAETPKSVGIVTYAQCSFCWENGEYRALFTLPQANACICDWCIWNFGESVKQPQNKAAIELAKFRRNALYAKLNEAKNAR